MSQTLNRSELTTHLESLRQGARVIPLNQLLSRQVISCVDGRSYAGVIATPGGNAGLFLQMLAAYELLSKQELAREQVILLFTTYLERFGRFDMHTDDHALFSLLKTLQERRSPIASFDHLISLISSPPPPFRPVILGELCKPAHTGCGHIRLMMQSPELYRIRPFLITAFIQEFFMRFWSGDDRLQFDILHGDHAEQAVLNIHFDEAYDPDTAPLVLVAPQQKDIQVFINHPEATIYMRRQHATFLHANGLLSENDIAAFLKLHHAVHTSQLTATVQALGATLPIFDVTLDESLEVQKIERTG